MKEHNELEVNFDEGKNVFSLEQVIVTSELKAKELVDIWNRWRMELKDTEDFTSKSKEQLSDLVMQQLLQSESNMLLLRFMQTILGDEDSKKMDEYKESLTKRIVDSTDALHKQQVTARDRVKELKKVIAAMDPQVKEAQKIVTAELEAIRAKNKKEQKEKKK